MSDVELEIDKRRVKTPGRMEISWLGVCISLPLSTQVELQQVGVFLRQRHREREIDQEPGRYVEGGWQTY